MDRGSPRWGMTFRRRVGRGEDHASAALAADDAEARRGHKPTVLHEERPCPECDRPLAIEMRGGTVGRLLASSLCEPCQAQLEDRRRRIPPLQMVLDL